MEELLALLPLCGAHRTRVGGGTQSPTICFHSLKADGEDGSVSRSTGDFPKVP